MVCADERIKKDLRPEGEYAQAVRIDGFVQLLRQKIIDKTEVEQHKPHAHTLVHIIALDDGFAQPILPGRLIGNDGEHERENNR